MMEKTVFLWALLAGTPQPRTDHIAILDYSIASQHSFSSEKGKLCSYRGNGESVLTKDNFVWVDG